jgi:hypothetical protein
MLTHSQVTLLNASGQKRLGRQEQNLAKQGPNGVYYNLPVKAIRTRSSADVHDMTASGEFQYPPYFSNGIANP